jgi:glycosyltransferase involved in cell wall biosynthesis
MRILDVSPRVVDPPTRGSTVRIHNLMRQLSVRHEVRQFSQGADGFALRDSVEEREVTPSYSEYRYSSPITSLAVEAGRRAFLDAPVFSGVGLRLARPRSLTALLRWADVVIVEWPWQFEHCRRQRPKGRIVLASHNVESLKFPSWAEAAGRSLSGGRLRYIASSEANAARRADLVLTVSAPDRSEVIRRYGADPGRVVEIPNGADTERYRPTGPDATRAAKLDLGLPDKPTVIYVASEIPPNRRGLEWICRLGERTDRFTFLVIGSVADTRPPGSNVVAERYVEDIGPYLDAADMAICPIEHGGGTKIKLLEYFAAGLPTVAFRDALHGVAARTGMHVLVAEKREDELLSGLNRLADDHDLACAIGAAARRLATERYDWAEIARRLEGHLLGLIDADGRPAPALTPLPGRG